MGGETIKRREARLRRSAAKSAAAAAPARMSSENKQLWLQMTPNQRALAIELSKGGVRQIDAFRLAYKRDKDDEPKSIYQQAWVASRNEKVVKMSEALIGTFDAQGYSNPAQTRAFVINKLTDLATNNTDDMDGVPHAVQMQSAVWLGKTSHARLFVEQSEVVNRDVSMEDARQQLLDAFSSLVSPAVPAEVSPANALLEAEVLTDQSEE